ncbi:MAG TPA: tetraacyldisaccharide 4'-kinase [Gemmatimonadales bacterium]
MARRGRAHRLIRWLWTSRRLDARLARLGLLPAAGLYQAGTSLRTLAYRQRWLGTRPLPLPSVAVGNLTVGGSGKTPIASWVAGHYAARGLRPGVLLRGYRGGDEALVHRQRTPEAVVVTDPDRVAGADRALAEGAQVLVLDDAFQRLDVSRDLNIAVVSAESGRAVRWVLPAGPWREGRGALRRADALIVTRRRADPASALELARDLAALVSGPVAVVQLAVRSYEGLVSGRRFDADTLAGRRVVAASGIGDPEAFIAQTKATGAAVQAATWRDHYGYRDEDVAWLAKAARKADYVVMTQKDAVKLRDRWPASVPEPLVALLDLAWEEGHEAMVQALDNVVEPLTS